MRTPVNKKSWGLISPLRATRATPTTAAGRLLSPKFDWNLLGFTNQLAHHLRLPLGHFDPANVLGLMLQDRVYNILIVCHRLEICLIEDDHVDR